MNTTTSDIATRLKAIPTASISDAMDSLDIHGTLHGLAPLTYDFRIGGPAFTVQYEPAGTERGSVGDFLDDVPPGAVVLIDNHARTDVTVWGGIMTEIAAARGIGGTVINGVCRDLNAALRQNYPLFSRAPVHAHRQRPRPPGRRQHPSDDQRRRNLPAGHHLR
jgi:4-hydroxy-4-methyl-2-oxoglutarate aldolase